MSNTRLSTILVASAFLWACGGESGEPEGPPEPVYLGDCSDRQGLPAFSTDPTVRESVEGTNGMFVEACDASGDLITYNCQMTTCSTGSTVDCAPFPTGEVISGTLACQGQCENGTCPKESP